MEKFEKDLKNKKLHVKYVNWMIRGVKNYLSGKNTNGLALPQLTDITNWKTHPICFTSTSNCVFLRFQLNYINKYHEEVLKKVGDECKKRGKDKVLSWIEKETTPLQRNQSNSIKSTTLHIFLLFSHVLCFYFVI